MRRKKRSDRKFALVGLAAGALAATAALAQVQYPRPLPYAMDGEQGEARRALETRIHDIANAFNGDIGIAVRDVEQGWTIAFDGDTYFPQQSVSKFWVAMTALDKAD